MATFTGNKVKDTYQSLLKLASGTLSSTLKTVEDGLGNVSALKVGTAAVEVKELLITDTPTVSNSENTVLVYDDVDKTVKVRELGDTAFGDTGSVNALYGRTESTQTVTSTPTRISYNTVANTGASNSFQVGSSFSLADSNRNIVVASDGAVRVEIALYVYFTNINSDIVITLKQGSTTIVSANRTKASGGTYNVVTFSSVIAANASDALSVEVSSPDDGVIVQQKSLVMAMKIFDQSFT